MPGTRPEQSAREIDQLWARAGAARGRGEPQRALELYEELLEQRCQPVPPASE